MTKSFEELCKETSIPLAMLIAYEVGTLSEQDIVDKIEAGLLCEAYSAGSSNEEFQKFMLPFVGKNITSLDEALGLLDGHCGLDLPLVMALTDAANGYANSFTEIKRLLNDLIHMRDDKVLKNADEIKSFNSLRNKVYDRAIDMALTLEEWDQLLGYKDSKYLDAKMKERWAVRGISLIQNSNDARKVAFYVYGLPVKETLCTRVRGLITDFEQGVAFFLENLSDSQKQVTAIRETARVKLIPLARNIKDCSMLMFGLRPNDPVYRVLLNRMKKFAKAHETPPIEPTTEVA